MPPKAAPKSGKKKVAPLPFDPKKDAAPSSSKKAQPKKGAKAAKSKTQPKKAIGKKAGKPDGRPKQPPRPKIKSILNPNVKLYEKRARNFGIGGDLCPKRDLTHFVKWPKYIRLQRQKRILFDRLKVPPAVHQFSRTLDKNTAAQLFKLLNKYKPEDKAAKKARLLALAKARIAKRDQNAEKAKAAKTAAKAGDSKADNAKADTKADAKAAKAAKADAKATKVADSKRAKPRVVKYGINHIAALVEQKKAKLVVIAHDVDPVEIVIWLPALCRKMNVPYVVVKGKARLGQVVHKKTASALAITSIKKKDSLAFQQLLKTITDSYSSRYDEFRKQWGGGKLGIKSTVAKAKKEKALRKEELSRQRA